VARRQRTIRNVVSFRGKALFSGLTVQATLRPAAPNTGTVFVRTDLPDSPIVPANAESMTEGFRRTILQWNEVQIESVEHILAAAMGLSIDNLTVELTGKEPPAHGGNALGWAALLQQAEPAEQDADQPGLTVAEPLAVTEGPASIVALPPLRPGLNLTYVMDFDGRWLPIQSYALQLSPEAFLEELAPCRTFSPESAYDEFVKRNIGGGVDDQNSLLIREDGTVVTPISRAPADLHFPDECVRHKVLDLVGDLALAGLELNARIIAVRSGHSLNREMVRQLVAVHKKGKPAAEPEPLLDIREIQKVLPHRFPFLLVDRVLAIEEDKRIVGLKNVSINEHFFQGHYPDYPIMPGVLQIEAMAQIAGVLLLRKLEYAGKLALLVAVESVRLRKPVVPGDQITLEAEAVRVRPRTAQVNARCLVGPKVVSEAVLKFMLVDAEVL
jgi:UDP-3-O-[3-hydroxymyristoyl] N-acetylglucosamine deacetylase/3-hydroxyacyl-[acyl-carrier-protein] dehydratase